MEITKIEIARRELGAALHLFICDLCPVAVQVLASAGAEVARSAAILAGKTVTTDHMERVLLPGQGGRLIKAIRKPYNALKHYKSDEDAHIDAQTLVHFDDWFNSAILFMGWTDYKEVTGKLPNEAHAFRNWHIFRRGDPELLEELQASDADRKLHSLPYHEAKKDLAVRVAQLKNAAQEIDEITEHGPLVFSR